MKMDTTFYNSCYAKNKHPKLYIKIPEYQKVLGIVSLDIVKAYNTAWHPCIIKKLQKFLVTATYCASSNTS